MMTLFSGKSKMCCGQDLDYELPSPLWNRALVALGTLRWRHNGRDGVSNHQPHDCLLNSLFGRRSKKTSEFRVTGLCAGNSRGLVNSPHNLPVTRKMSPFDDVIMHSLLWLVGVFICHKELTVSQEHTLVSPYKETKMGKTDHISILLMFLD